jgi:hypothetical protein
MLKQNGRYYLFGMSLFRIALLNCIYSRIHSSKTVMYPPRSALIILSVFIEQPTERRPGSRLTGWNPNDNLYTTSTSLTSGWSSWQIFTDKGSNTYFSQTNFILPVTNSLAIYMGDRWRSENLARSTYVWLPLTISGTSVSMKNMVNWIPDVNAGTAIAGPSEGSYEAESSTLAGGAKSVTCSGCSGSKAAGYIGGSSNGAVTFANVNSNKATRTTVRIKYENGNTAERYADVQSNGGAKQRVAFVQSDDGNTPASAVVNLDLRQGSNSLIIQGVGDGSWGPDLDRIMVPVE